jgi:uncharacterized protein YutE (UPF0331/DUF86 family)
MRLDLYQAETALIAQEQSSLLDEAKVRIASGQSLTRLEMNGVLHAIQVLVENSIGKAKHLLKAAGDQVPVSAYDAFSQLVNKSIISSDKLHMWNAAIGLRNRIVHDYMNIDMELVLGLVASGQYQFIADFLLSSELSQSFKT